jgi:hypothetical protein
LNDFAFVHKNNFLTDRHLRGGDFQQFFRDI